VANGVPADQAGWIFDLIEKFAGYGFNKSHSAAYAVLTYQTAWLKQHYPAAFMAAVMSADIDDTDKVAGLLYECRKNMGLTVLPPDVNASSHPFTVAGERALRYGLGAVRGVGAQAVEALVDERQRNGPYTSLAELCRRIDLSRVNRRVLEALIKAGAMDALGANRATLMFSLDAAVQGGEQATRASAAGQDDLFGGGGHSTIHVQPAVQTEWPERVRLAHERETLGAFLSGHPVEGYESELKRLVSARLGDLAAEPPPTGDAPRWSGGRQVTVAGLIDELRKRNGRTSFVLDDSTGKIEVTLFEELAVQYRELLTKDAMVLVEGSLRFDDFSNAWRIAGKRVSTLSAVREQRARRLILRWPREQAMDPPRLTARLKELLATATGGDCDVLIRYETAAACCVLGLDRAWSVRPTAQLMEGLESLLGPGALRLQYDPAAAQG
jgi:DNA polymerase-3 subunit alpha